MISLFCLNFQIVNGCEGLNHPWEGREALGEGASWAQQCSRESLLLERRGEISCSMGSIESIVLILLLGVISGNMNLRVISGIL